VDEHTALVFDLATGRATVLGNGTVTVRHDGASRVLPSGTVVPIAELAERSDGGGRGHDEAAETGDAGGRGRPRADGRGAATRGGGGAGGATGGTCAAGGAGATGGALRPPTSLRGAADRARAAFDAAMAARDADAAASAVLELEQAITDWTADTLQSDDGGHARRTLRAMVLELAVAARDGLADPTTRIAPLVDALLERRAAARSARDFATADALRDRLAAAGVEVRDGPSGAEWNLRG